MNQSTWRGSIPYDMRCRIKWPLWSVFEEHSIWFNENYKVTENVRVHHWSGHNKLCLLIRGVKSSWCHLLPPQDESSMLPPHSTVIYVTKKAGNVNDRLQYVTVSVVSASQVRLMTLNNLLPVLYIHLQSFMSRAHTILCSIIFVVAIESSSQETNTFRRDPSLPSQTTFPKQKLPLTVRCLLNQHDNTLTWNKRKHYFRNA